MINADTEQVVKKRVEEGLTPMDIKNWKGIKKMIEKGRLEKESKKLIREKDEYKKSKILADKQTS